jgi:Rieske Fe-S protein
MSDDRRAPLDVAITPPGREGLTGTAPAGIYKPVRDGELMTLAPDGRPMEEQPAWRTDFPIDWPQDHYVERRDFVNFLFLTSLAFTVGQVWIAGQNWWRRRRGQPPIARVATLDQIPVGGVLTFTYPTPDDPCVLVRPSENAMFAYNQKCTHLSCAVRPRVREGVIHCPCHEGYFDLATGRPLSGPPRRPLALVHIEVRRNQVFATGVEERTV